MKNDNYRNYVTEAFRYYAYVGRPEADLLRRLRTGTTDFAGEIADLEAVNRLIRRLKSEPDGEIPLRCLEEVYFAAPRSIPKRGAITKRVRQTAESLCISESVVYRALRRLRHMFALERGLRVGNVELAALEAAARSSIRKSPPCELHSGQM